MDSKKINKWWIIQPGVITIARRSLNPKFLMQFTLSLSDAALETIARRAAPGRGCVRSHGGVRPKPLSIAETDETLTPASSRAEVVFLI